MASLKKRKDGRYAKQITIGIKDGKPVKKTVYGKTLKQLEENYINLKRELEQGINLDLNTATVKDLMEEWYKIDVEPNIRENTRRKYVYSFTSIYEELGCFKVSDVKMYHIEYAIHEFRKTGNEAARFKLIILNRFFNYCVDHDIIMKNPCKRISIPRNKPDKRKLERFELEKIENSDLPIYDKAFLFLLRYTGARVSEINALCKSDINFKDMYIDINKTVSTKVDTHPFIQHFPKTEAGKRKVPILIPLYKVLNEYVSTLKCDDYLLFSLGDNKPLYPANQSKRLKNILRKCDVDYTDITPHSFRHNFISECYYAGIDVKTVQSWVGHSDIKTTLDIYTHLSESEILNGSQMNEFYNGSQTEVKRDFKVV